MLITHLLTNILNQKAILLTKNMRHGSHKLYLAIIIFSFYSFISYADVIEGHSVKIQILDKITAKINNIEVDVNDTYEFGTLKIEIYACYKRPPEEIPEDFILLRIYDILNGNKPEKIYQGWMISSSPSATPFEHPIYDLWIKQCKIYKD